MKQKVTYKCPHLPPSKDQNMALLLLQHGVDGTESTKKIICFGEIPILPRPRTFDSLMVD